MEELTKEIEELKKKLERIAKIAGYKEPKEQSGQMVSVEELKNFLNLNVELNPDGTIKKAYFGEKKERKQRAKKA